MARYVIQPERSEVRIGARSSLHPIDAVTTGIEGFVEAEVTGGTLDLGVPPSGHLDLPVELLTSGNPLYDREMRRRIDARRFPTISGDLTGMRAGDGPGRYLVAGDVTFRGVTRHFEDEMAISMPDEATMRLEGAHTFDVREFQMEPPKIMMLKVHPDVAVTVTIVARAAS